MKRFDVESVRHLYLGPYL